MYVSGACEAAFHGSVCLYVSETAGARHGYDPSIGSVREGKRLSPIYTSAGGDDGEVEAQGSTDATAWAW